MDPNMAGGPRRMPMGQQRPRMAGQTPMGWGNRLMMNQGGPNQGPPPRYPMGAGQPRPQQQQAPGGQMPPHVMQQNQQVPSPGAPVGFIPSPASNQMMNQQPSPMSNPGSIRGMAPSPMSTSIATPSDEDHAYFEKVKQLGKYIEPLRQMIAGIGK